MPQPTNFMSDERKAAPLPFVATSVVRGSCDSIRHTEIGKSLYFIRLKGVSSAILGSMQ
ncbi:hypothetical protein NBRC116601_34680 [Cognatishimia sp. WU-CL00825]